MSERYTHLFKYTFDVLISELNAQETTTTVPVYINEPCGHLMSFISVEPKCATCGAELSGYKERK